MPETGKSYAYFDNTKTGIISEFQRVIYDERIQVKKSQKGADSV